MSLEQFIGTADDKTN